MKISERGYWENNSTEGHGVDPGLMNALDEFFLYYPSPKIMDIGCGDGSYTLFLKNAGYHCDGYDGNPFTEQITKGTCQVADFSEPQYLAVHDWVLCLEVGEHIPPEYEDIFISNLDRHCFDGIILSWAVPGQGGNGHVNCHTNEYIESKFKELGYRRNHKAEDFLRNSCATYPTPCYWFRNTLMVFDRIK